VQKIAFHLGPFAIHWFGLLVAMGFMVGLWTSSRRAARDGIPPAAIFDAGVWLILGALVGARVLYVLTYWDNLMREPLNPSAPWTEVFMIQRGGLVFHGGLVGATAAALIYVRRRRLPVWKFADALAPGIALGSFLGRFGCLMNGCCYGRPTGLPWAIHFPADLHETRGAGVHPVQIYDSLLNLALCLGLAWLHRRRRFEGQVFAAYLLGYAVVRTVAEWFRGDYPPRLTGAGLTPGQWQSLAVLVAGAALWWTLARRGRAGTPSR
jgi:phosphatidylglycerol:prolipoprotein diacylglycerol transferase